MAELLFRMKVVQVLSGILAVPSELSHGFPDSLNF
jgi:hypothetical protein